MNMLKIYTTKPKEIEAAQYTCTNITEIEHFIQRHNCYDNALLEEHNASYAKVDDIRKRNLGRFDRFCRICIDGNNLDIFKNDYLCFEQNRGYFTTTEQDI